MGRVADARRSAGMLREPALQSVLFLVFVGIVGVQAAPPALSSVGSALSVPDGRLGLVITAFFLPAAVALPVVGFVADVYGRRPVAVGSLLVYGLAGMATALATDFTLLLVCRAAQGVAFPGLIPLSITLAGDFYAGERASLAQGLRISVNGVAATVTPAVAGVLAGMVWYYPFWLSALALPVAAFVYRFMPTVNPDEDAGTGDQSWTGYLGTYVRSVGAAVRDPTLLVLLVGAFVAFFSRYAVITFLPLFAVRELGTSAATGGLLLSVIGVTRIVVPLSTGTVVGATSRKRVLLGTLGIATLATVAMPILTDVWLLAGLVAVYGIVLSLFLPVLNDTVSAMAPAERRAGVVNTMELGKTAAIAFSPAVFGLVLGLAGFTTLFALAGALLGAYALLAAAVVGRDAIADAVTQPE